MNDSEASSVSLPTGSRLSRLVGKAAAFFLAASSVASTFTDYLQWSKFLGQIVAFYRLLAYPIFDLISFSLHIHISREIRDVYSILYSLSICWMIAYGERPGAAAWRRLLRINVRPSMSPGNPILESFKGTLFFLVIPAVMALVSPALVILSAIVPRMRPVFLGTCALYIYGILLFFSAACVEFYYSLIVSNWKSISNFSEFNVPSLGIVGILAINSALIIVALLWLLVRNVRALSGAAQLTLADIHSLELITLPSGVFLLVKPRLVLQPALVRINGAGDIYVFFSNGRRIGLGMRMTPALRLSVWMATDIKLVDWSSENMFAEDSDSRLSWVPVQRSTWLKDIIRNFSSKHLFLRYTTDKCQISEAFGDIKEAGKRIEKVDPW